MNLKSQTRGYSSEGTKDALLFLDACQLRIKSGQVLRDLRIKTGHPLEVLGFEGLDVNKSVFVPES